MKRPLPNLQMPYLSARSNPQRSLFPDPAESARFVSRTALYKRLWKRQCRHYAVVSAGGRLRLLERKARKLRSAARVRFRDDYTFDFPQASRLCGNGDHWFGNKRAIPLPKLDDPEFGLRLMILLEEISTEIIQALERPCLVHEDDDYVRVEFMDRIAWVLLVDDRYVGYEIKDQSGFWQLARPQKHILEPLDDPSWVDQVLFSCLEWFVPVSYADATAGYAWLRKNVVARFHDPDWLSGLRAQVSHHVHRASRLDQVFSYFKSLHPSFALDSHHFQEFWRNEPFWSDLFHRKRDMVYFYCLARKQGLITTGDDLGVLRSRCLEMGLGPAAWRFLGRHGVSAYRAAIEPNQGMEKIFANALGYIDWQSRAGLSEPLHYVLGLAYIRICGMILVAEGGHRVDPRVAKAAANHVATLKNDNELMVFNAQQWVPVLVWMRDENPQIDRNQWRSGWPAIWRACSRWRLLHENKFAWHSPLGEFEFRGWKITPLTSSYAVAVEGIRMSHCAADYTKRCKAGIYRLFSVTDNSTGKPLATLGFIKEQGEWQLDQVRGKANRDPGKELRALGQLVLHRMRQSC